MSTRTELLIGAVFLFMLASLARMAVNGTVSFWEETTFTANSNPDSFFVLEDPAMNVHLDAIRTKECAGVSTVLVEARKRFKNRSEAQKKDRQFAQTLMFALTQREVRQGTMSHACLVHVSEGGRDENSFWALLNPKGDVVIGYHAIAPYTSRYSVEPYGYVLNVIAFGRGSVLVSFDMKPIGKYRLNTASID